MRMFNCLLRMNRKNLQEEKQNGSEKIKLGSF